MTRLLAIVPLLVAYLVVPVVSLLMLAVYYWPVTVAAIVIGLALCGVWGWALLILLCALAVLCSYLFSYLVRPS